MKLLVAGSRGFTNYEQAEVAIGNFLESHPHLDVDIVSGGARGADEMGEMFSREVLEKEPDIYPADWDRYGKSAGYIRNEEMACVCTHAVVFWDGKSKGTKNMLQLLAENNVNDVWVIYVNEPDIVDCMDTLLSDRKKIKKGILS